MTLLTGDSGFIGRQLVKKLLDQGESVVGLDTVPAHDSSTNYPHISGSILDMNAVMRAMHNVDCVIHLAAEHKDFGVPEENYFKVNVSGTKLLLDCASQVGVKRFVFFSSVAVYGSAEIPNEEAKPQPSNAYGKSKLEAERVVVDWARGDSSREVIIIRPAVVFGPNNRANIFKLISYVCDKKFVWVGRGDNIKSIAYVGNLVEATLFLLKKIKPGVEIFNYSDEPQLTTRELVEIIAMKAGVKMPTLSIPLGIALPAAKLFDLLGYLTKRDCSISTARIKKFNTSTCYRAEKIRSLGFKPPYSIEEGIERNVAWYKKEQSSSEILSYLNFGEH